MLRSVGALGKQMRPLAELAAGADGALRMAPSGLTGGGAASFLATCAQESAYFRTTVEYGTGQRYAPYIGRGFVQCTWRENYRAFGAWCRDRGLGDDPGVFEKNPAALGDYRWSWLTAVWYFEANRLWDWANAGDHLRVSQAVNGGRGRAGTAFVPNHWDARRAMFDAFRRVGDGLLPAGVSPPRPANAPPPAGPEAIPDMQEGDTGQHVHRLASWLVTHYPAYSKIPLDPNPRQQRYGPRMVEAVREFQSRPPGVVAGADAVGTPIGPRTKRKLWAAGYRP
ncbi:hypothetical protein WY02_03455 [Pseudonocardia sp. AL041005-10]|nr:hypothetical protein WY02_03455 [Pseudonocardia sp. AL041005-10]